ncbi:hypothetical protein [Halomonas sp. 707D7]|uniref:hypothetical protein n=1 Tax=Halomonas sp. 707D7 TaxID=1681044 RepID=UPI00209DF1C7|nr:hypothetical protein [Halomonas sp. 707D7]MCP1313003.1 hypothetical protein [Halomonas sp. 707D7]
MKLYAEFKRRWRTWKAKHWDIDFELREDTRVFFVDHSVPPLRARWEKVAEAIKPILKKRGPELVIGVLTGIVVTLLLALFGL